MECTKCDRNDLTVDDFALDPARPSGRRTECNYCRRERARKYRKRYYAKNRDKVLDYQRKYYQQKKEKSALSC